MDGYELSEWVEPGTMRRVLPDGTVQVHKVGPGTDVPGPGFTIILDEGAMVASRLRRDPPEWWLEAMRGSRR